MGSGVTPVLLRVNDSPPGVGVSLYALLLVILQPVPDQLPVIEVNSRSADESIISLPRVAKELMSLISKLAKGAEVLMPTRPKLFKGERMILPVVSPPRVRAWLLVV